MEEEKFKRAILLGGNMNTYYNHGQFSFKDIFNLKGSISLLKFLKSLLITIVVEALAFYWALPEMNIHSAQFWTFQGFMVLLFLVLSAVLPDKNNKKIPGPFNIASKIAGIILAVGFLNVIIGNIWSAEFFHAYKYASLIDIKDTEFEKALENTDVISNIALMDTSSAKVVGQRAIGALSDVVSQYEISDEYSQIAYNGEPMKVASLEYAGFFKWFNNRKSGIPGYVLVDAVKFEAEYVKLSKPIKYTTSGWFNDNLQRHLRFQYPTAIFEGYYFELDEKGNPYYICPVLTAKVGLFGGYDVKGVVICDPCSGESEYYKLGEIPQWVDRVYDGDLIEKKYNWYGLLSDGFWNSIIGQKDCKKATDDYGYKVIDNDVWVYTGVTSVIDDSSNIGFLMVNSRTGKGSYFKVAGAEEYSAMEAAEGQVQNLGYRAAFPSLINIDNRPTYFMVLKDKGNLVKQYALVDVKKYSIVATGVTQKETLSTYRKLLKENNIAVDQSKSDLSEVYKNVTIKVSDIKYINKDENTYVYITDMEGNVYKELFSSDETLIFIKEGDSLKIFFEENEETKIRVIESWEYADK